MLFHSEGAEVFKGTEFHMFSWSSALVHKGDVLDHKIFICCIEESLLVAGKMIEELIRYFSWNHDIMHGGCYPIKDHRASIVGLGMASYVCVYVGYFRHTFEIGFGIMCIELAMAAN